MTGSVESFVLTILAILVIVIFGGSIYAFIQAIFLFIFSAGDADKIKKAWNSIRYMILGIFMSLAFLFIFPLVFKKIRLPGYESYTANNIFNQAGELIKGVFLFGREAITDYSGSLGSSSDPDPSTTPLPSEPPSDQPLEL